MAHILQFRSKATNIPPSPSSFCFSFQSSCVNFQGDYNSDYAQFFLIESLFQCDKVILLLQLKMQKIFCLPKISIKQMQSKVRQQRATHKKYNYEQNCAENDRSHHQGIKITSPFFERKHHKQKCECRYHKFKREMQIHRKIREKKEATIYEKKSRGIDLNQTIEKERFLEITNIVSNKQVILPNKLLQPLPITLTAKTQIDNLMNEDRNNNESDSNSKSIKQLPNRKTFKSLQCKPILQTLDETINCRIDAMNEQFIELISKRFQNEKFKQKYIKTLFGFIKMKYNQNKKYIHKSKAYIQNSLNMLLNHYSLEKLLDFSKLTNKQINQIGYYMNCFPDKVKGILYDLGKVVSQMEKALYQIKKKRDKKNEQFFFIYGQDQMQNIDHYKINQNNQGLNSLQEYNYKNALTKDSYLLLGDQNKSSFADIGSSLQQNKTNDNDSNLLKTNQQQKHSIMKSSRKLIDLISSKKDMLQNKQPSQLNMRKSIRISQRNQQLLNRNLRSTVLGIVDQLQKQAHLIKKQSTKSKKGKLKSKQSQIDQRYLNVQYQKYLTKKQFHNLINQIERPDLNDAERGLIIFKELSVQNFLENHQKIQEIIKTFKPLFNGNSLHYFLKQIVTVRDKRYIEKLEKQLDEMLQQIKKNDPRGQTMDFFQAKPQKKVPSFMNKMTKCRELKVEKKESINHIKYFEAQQEIQRHRTKEKSIKIPLEQIPLQGIHFDTIDSNKSRIITHSQSPKRQIDSLKGHANLPDIQCQKNILRYMKQKHEGTFNYLASEFVALSKSLSKQNL